jgi:NADPH-dependent curcumin reductase CurA
MTSEFNPATINHQWRVARYPAADELISADHFDWTEAAIQEPAAGEFLVRTICLTPIPAQRGYLDDRQSKFLGERIPLGAVMRGRGLGEIVASKHPDYQPGEIFVGSLGWQEYSLQHPSDNGFVFSTCKIRQPRKPLSLHMGILGQAGGTAYFGLTEGGQIKAGDKVLISAAAGGVGSAAGQIARILGADSVIGITGSDAKCDWLCNELGYTAAINYTTADLDAELARLFPDGIDLFLDSVGGNILNTALNHLAMHARIAIGGYISTQYAAAQSAGPANYYQLLIKRARMQGFVYFDYWDRYAETETLLCDWYDQGLLKNTEHLTMGLENMPTALANLFTGENMGISLCQVGTDPGT